MLQRTRGKGKARPLGSRLTLSENVQHLCDERVADDVALLQADDADIAAHRLDAVGNRGEAREFGQQV